MDIALYLKHFPPTGAPLLGGTQKALHGLAAGLAECGARATVLCEAETSSTVVSETGYTIHCFANAWRRTPFMISRALKQYLTTSADRMTVLNGLFTPSVYAVSRTMERVRKPFVFAPHGVYQPELFRRHPHLKFPYWYAFERHVLRAAAAVQVHDARHEHWLRRRGIRTRTFALPNGVFATDVPPESSLRWRRGGGPAFFFFGRMDVYGKGLDLLLHAFAQTARGTEATLTIQGPTLGREQELKELAAKLSVMRQVSVLGPDYDTPASIRMGQYDVVCLTSRWDSFPTSGLEAMAAGRVLLLSKETGLAPHVEASGSGALVLPTVESVGAGIRDLLARRSEWQEMGMRGRRYVMEHLQWRHVGSRALEEFGRLTD